MKKEISIAIDGPAGSGKSTIARLVAKKLGIGYIDSGAIYRAYTLQSLREEIELEDEASVNAFLERTRVDVENGGTGTIITVNGEDVTHEIRSLEVTSHVSSLAENKSVRELITARLRGFAEMRSVVMEGRDIGTIVLPDATLKIFVTASKEERALRRYQDLKLAGVQTDLERTEFDIQKRDKQDSQRKTAPLQRAVDALVLDTTYQDIDESVNFVVKEARKILS